MVSFIVRSIQDDLATPDEPALFLWDPYIVAGGITYLHSRPSVGKSPLSWEIARCVSQGLPCLNLPTHQSKVLYLEADTPPAVVRPRLRQMPHPWGDWMIAWCYGATMNLATDPPVLPADIRVWRQWEPHLVIWNTIRRFHSASGLDAETPALIYRHMARLFPGSAHLITAHDRKESRDEHARQVSDEDFHGSRAWLDLAQVGLHLVKARKGQDTWLRLDHTKSQVSELNDSLSLDLDVEGTRLLPRANALAARAQAMYDQAPGLTISARVEWTARELHRSVRTVYRWLKLPHDAPRLTEP